MLMITRLGIRSLEAKDGWTLSRKIHAQLTITVSRMQQRYEKPIFFPSRSV